MATDGETSAVEGVEWHVKTKRTLLPVEWTDVVVEDVSMVSATALEMLAARRFVRFMQRGNRSRATRSAGKGPRRRVKVFAEI